ncbi:choice-of-anchor A family protein [Kitasatospora sp. NBC_01287]|uniref:choice-of-anchor A family protein n=1 Tax=Kitasatospora sp. NBC_01287 TaxID=2903573 RepID=UPI00224C8DEB|nr:choice-of-anchor A family protein [Kitasatospora sp. NBC_01287]MCX4746245.1 choice-of-anchor A family protein [Kitasatospora sp. NBC_01287]
MRIPVPVPALALGGSLILGGSLALGALAAPAAVAAPASPSCPTLGVAGQYGEFIEGDDTHAPDAEGAVAVGGNADFSHGFSVGQELTDAEVKALPGQNALVVAGDINVGGGNTEVMKGNGVYAGQKLGGGLLEGHAGTVTHGPLPIDFAAEFTELRGISTALAARGATPGTTAVAAGQGDGATLTLTGTDASYNNFVVSAAQLQGAKAIRLKVPAGAVAVVNVTGGSYDSQAAGTTSIWLWDHGKQSWVEDDKLQSADGGAVRASLLWNFPTATSVVKNSLLAWAGSILAPNADFALGHGGPVNGSVIAHSLTGSGGAETHHSPFTACLPSIPTGSPSPSASASGPATTPPTGGGPSTPATTPVGTPGSSASGTPSGSPSTGPSGTPSTGGSAHPVAAPSGTPATPSPGASASGALPVGAPSTGPSPAAPAPSHGGLAFTGAAGVIPLTVGGVLVVGAGAGIVVATRRRAARKA